MCSESVGVSIQWDAVTQEADLAPKPTARRVKLKPWDLMPAQMLNNMGASSVQAAPHFSELCDLDPNRKAIAMSRISEVNLKTGAKLALEESDSELSIDG